MPWFDTAARRWKIFYCNETDGTTRTAVASNEGMDSLSHPNSWTWSDEQPSQKTYSISNPFEVGGKSYVFLDYRLFAVSLAVSDTGPAGPYTLLPDSNTPLINRTEPGNRSWIENPIVTPLPSKRFAAMFDWVQGGGQPAGSPLPYLGFAWSPTGLDWPAENGELVSVEPAGGGKIWSDLVRTPTALIPEEDGSYTVFYAARDTRNASSRTGNATQPYTNCSVPPAETGRVEDAAGARGGEGSAPPPPPPGWGDGCFWGIGKVTLRLSFPKDA